MNQHSNLDDKARRIQEVFNKLGWDADISSLVERIKQLDSGLVQEDEFFYLLKWSGKCSLVHKLDQFQVPETPKKIYTIPDLYVVFNINAEKKPYYIEVKTSKDNHLSWTETYYQGLLNYSESTNVPILIAWKWKSFDIWTLFELKNFKKSVSNYKIDLETAHVENLMSKFVGDYLVVPYDGFGFHLKFKKEEIIEELGNETTFKVILESAYFTGKGGKTIQEIDNGVLTLLFSLHLEEKVTMSDTHIISSYFPSNDKSAFAQSIPIRITRAFSKDEINWLQMIKDKKYPIGYDELLNSFKKGIDKEIIRNILFFIPKSE